MSKPPETENDWKYEHQPKQKELNISVLGMIRWVIRHLVLFFYFMVLPGLVLVGVSWPAKVIFHDTFFGDWWMMPALIVVSVFLAGVFSRQLMETQFEDKGKSMFLFELWMLGLGAFTYIALADAQNGGVIFSGKLMPRPLQFSYMPYIMASPLVGIIGMFFYRVFSFKP